MFGNINSLLRLLVIITGHVYLSGEAVLLNSKPYNDKIYN